MLNLTCHRQVSLYINQFGMLLLGTANKSNLLYRLVNGQLQVIQINGLGGKVECPVVHGVTNVVHVAISAHHDALERRVSHLVDLGQQGQTIHLGHIDVGEDDVNVGVLEQHL